MIFTDQSANAAVTELQSQYEQQIKEYQSNIKQALEETGKVRTELKQFHEENLLKEKQINELINSLKQEKEKLQSELNHRGKLSSSFPDQFQIIHCRTSSEFHSQ